MAVHMQLAVHQIRGHPQITPSQRVRKVLKELIWDNLLGTTGITNGERVKNWKIGIQRHL